MARRNSENAKSFGASQSGSSDQARALRRSPIGELVFHYRQRLHLTQLDLAVRASSPLDAGLDSATVSERTVSSIEKLVGDDEPWNRPRPSTVRALAAAFGIGADTPE